MESYSENRRSSIAMCWATVLYLQVSGSRKFVVLVNRPKITQFGSITTYIMMAGMAINMLSFSVRLHTDIVRHHLRRPFAALIGIFCQFVVLPVVNMTHLMTCCTVNLISSLGEDSLFTNQEVHYVRNSVCGVVARQVRSPLVQIF
jgi:hypothetical protein